MSKKAGIILAAAALLGFASSGSKPKAPSAPTPNPKPQGGQPTPPQPLAPKVATPLARYFWAKDGGSPYGAGTPVALTPAIPADQATPNYDSTIAGNGRVGSVAQVMKTPDGTNDGFYSVLKTVNSDGSFSNAKQVWSEKLSYSGLVSSGASGDTNLGEGGSGNAGILGSDLVSSVTEALKG